MPGIADIMNYIPSTKALLYSVLGKYEGDWTPTEEPEAIWNEENVDLDTRKLRNDKKWQEGKDIHEQLTDIVNNRTIAYRMLDCCNAPVIYFSQWLPPLTCIYYAYAEHKILKINFFMALMKSFVMWPFLGPWWCTYSLRTVMREQQEVDGAEMTDWAAFFLCFMCQPFQLFMNAWKMPEEWFTEEFARVGTELDIQECHEWIEEKIHLD